MFTNADETKFAKKYLTDIKAAWDLISEGNPWWMQCQCGFTQIAVFDASYDAAYCSNCLAWLTPKCGDPDCDFCANRPDINHEMQQTMISLLKDELEIETAENIYGELKF